MGLVKFMVELIQFREIFAIVYTSDFRTPDMGHYTMVGFIMLLFIDSTGGIFLYIQTDSMLCSDISGGETSVCDDILAVVCGLIGDKSWKSLLAVMSALRERVWRLCEIEYETIHIDIDTTVETIYGNQQGGRKGHNTKNRGRRDFAPCCVL